MPGRIGKPVSTLSLSRTWRETSEADTARVGPARVGMEVMLTPLAADTATPPGTPRRCAPRRRPRLETLAEFARRCAGAHGRIWRPSRLREASHAVPP